MRAFAFCLLALCAALPPARLAAAEARLTLDYGDKHLVLTEADLAKLPVHEVQAIDHHVSHLYRGVAMSDVMALLGLPHGENFRGRMLALAAVAQASDGYAVVFSVAEFDENFRDTQILLVEAMDGKPLSDHDGPLRLVCPGDRRPARWIRQLTSIKVVALAPPRSSSKSMVPPPI